MQRRPFLAFVGLVMLPAVLVACGEQEPEVEPVVEAPAPAPAPAPGPVAAENLPPGVTAAMVQEGEQLYGTVCVACHGPGGAGTTLGPNLTDNEWLNIPGHDFEAIANVVRTGVPQAKQFPAPMPPMGGGNFTDDQVRALAAYVWTLSSPA